MSNVHPVFQDIFNKWNMDFQKPQPMVYRGYTIEPDYRNPYSNKPEFMFYPTEQGIDHDYDLVGEYYKYCGNCGWADTIEEAKDAIWEKIMMAQPKHKVVLKGRAPYEFDWLEDAIRFAVLFNAEEFHPAVTA